MLKITKGMEKKDKIEAITAALEDGVANLFTDERYREYLDKMSKVYRYSVNNILLILAQKPDASLVGSMKMWNDNFNRRVKKGETALYVLAPILRKHTLSVTERDENGIVQTDENGNPIKKDKEVQYTSYRPVPVFDVSQTEGDPLPQNRLVKELDGNVEDYDRLFKAIESVAPVPVAFEKMAESTKGYYDQCHIAIQEGMSQYQTIKTFVHELAHSLLHSRADNPESIQKDRRTKEVEAESIAYTVCSALGLDTCDYSFGYVAEWSKGRDTVFLMGCMDTIRKCASEIITKIEKALGIDESPNAEEDAA